MTAPGIINKFSAEEIQRIIDLLPRLTDVEREELEHAVTQYASTVLQERCSKHYLEAVKQFWPEFIPGRHIREMANAFERIADGTLKRLIICMPPGHSKSQNASIFLPAWYLGKFPGRRVVQCSHTADLAVDFGAKVLQLVKQHEYKSVFPDLALRTDQRAKGHWRTTKNGEYFAIGVGGKIAGRRAHLLIVDDPHSEQEYKNAVANPDIWDGVYDWFVSGPLTRLMPDGAVVIVMTRWAKKDLVGQILDVAGKNGTINQWEVIEFPALFESDGVDEHGDAIKVPKFSLWPEFWSLDKMVAKRQEITGKSLGVHLWNANYQQRPTSEEGALIKRQWWRIWDGPPPKCEYVIQAWDTAHTINTRSNPSACTTWGVFTPNPDNAPDLKNIILLNAFQAKLEFPELKARVLQEYRAWSPVDSLIIEAKASGPDVIAELRRMGIPVEDYTPARGTRAAPNDKYARTNGVADIWRSGMVWAPPYRWAEEVIGQMAEFPNGDLDDLHDSAVLAMRRFRDGGFIRLPSDAKEDEASKKSAGLVREYY